MENKEASIEESKDTPKVETKSSLGKWIKTLEWQDWTAIFLTIIILGIYLNLANSFVQVPSPVFGGDYFRDRGFVKNIVEGNPIWSDGFYVNEIQYYPYLIFVIQAGIVKATGLSVDQVFIYFPLLTTLLAAIVWYFLGNALFKNKIGGILTMTSMFGMKYFYGLKSSDFGLFVAVPLFLYFWLRYEQSLQRKFAVWSGIILGIIALIHGGRFLASISLLGVSVVIMLFIDLIKTKDHKEKWRLIKEYFLKYYLLFVIAIGISLIFFLPLYFKYQMHSVNNVTLWGDSNIELLGLTWVWGIFKSLFFDLSRITLFIASLISAIGLLTLLFIKKNFEQKWILIIAGANIIVLQHHLITRPLFNTYFNPGKLELITFFAPLFFTLGALMIIQQIGKIIPKINRKAVTFGIIILLLLPSFYYNLQDYQSSQWIKYGQQENEYIDSLYKMADYLTANMERDETILSNDESGFMLAVLSGRKVMLTRRTHATYYVDIDLRIAQASAAMYGNNLSLSKEIIKDYKVKYFYVDQNLLTYPMRVRTDLKDYLIRNQINFSEVYDRYDIALPLDQTNGMSLLLIPHQEINSKFLDLWKRVYQVKVEGQVVGELYELKKDFEILN